MINRANARLTDAAYVELVRSILSTLSLALIAGAAFAAVGATAVMQTGDPVLLVMLFAGLLATFARVTVLLIHRVDREGSLSAVLAGRIERRFAWSYLIFAAIFGLFMARAFMLGDQLVRLLAVGIVFGHGAGVAAGAALRPWIGLPAVLLGVVPLIMTSVFIADGEFWGVGALTLLYMIGGISTMLQRYTATARRLSLENLLANVSGRDELTGLLNQPALAQRFEELASDHRAGLMVAVHAIRFDGLDAINARHGFAAGDSVLKAAADRILTLAESGDFAARLGGATLIVVQPELNHPRLADALARHLHAGLSSTAFAARYDTPVVVNIGYAVALQENVALATLLDDAHDASERARLEGAGIARASVGKAAGRG